MLENHPYIQRYSIDRYTHWWPLPHTSIHPSIHSSVRSFGMFWFWSFTNHQRIALFSLFRWFFFPSGFVSSNFLLRFFFSFSWYGIVVVFIGSYIGCVWIYMVHLQYIHMDGLYLVCVVNKNENKMKSKGKWNECGKRREGTRNYFSTPLLIYICFENENLKRKSNVLNA